MNLKDFTAAFATEEACCAYLAARRWPNGPVCDKCGSIGNAGKSKRPRYWICHGCRAMFSVTHGTPMQHSRLPLPQWFLAIFLLSTSSKGVSALVLSRQLSVSYKTAWFLGHRIRALLDANDDTLKGVVEVDETYVGGKRRKGKTSKRDHDDDQPTGRGGSRKMLVMTGVERDGKAKARRGRTHGARTIARTVFDWVDSGAVLCTDELPAYRGIGRRFRAHLRVNHSTGEWVRRDPLAVTCAHTNTVESFNATIKRAIIGVWHWFSIKHADRYLHELSVRWNMRGMDNAGRFHLATNRLESGALPWKVLTA